MLQFSNEPPIESTRAAFRMLRTPTRGKLELYILSNDLLGCWTHFFGGRTVPCTGEDCEACKAGSSGRWHGYVSAVEVKTHERVIFECTASAAEHLAAYRAKHGTLRGCHTLASRTSARPNARVQLRSKPLDQAEVQLPLPMNVQAALCHIWGIPLTETTTAPGHRWANDVLHTPNRLPADRGNGHGDLELSSTDLHPDAPDPT